MRRAGRLQSRRRWWDKSSNHLSVIARRAAPRQSSSRVSSGLLRPWLAMTAMAELMNTSRSQLDRLLDLENTSVTLHTMQRAAMCVGLKLRLELG